MSSVPKFEFRMSTASGPKEPKRFVDALAATGSWWRDERSLIQFKRGPNDYVRIERRGQLGEILRDGECLQITGEAIDQNVIDTLWLWLTSRSWSLPRMNPEKSWNPQRPANTGSGLQQKQRWQS